MTTAKPTAGDDYFWGNQTDEAKGQVVAVALTLGVFATLKVDEVTGQRCPRCSGWAFADASLRKPRLYVCGYCGEDWEG